MTYKETIIFFVNMLGLFNCKVNIYVDILYHVHGCTARDIDNQITSRHLYASDPVK